MTSVTVTVTVAGRVTVTGISAAALRSGASASHGGHGMIPDSDLPRLPRRGPGDLGAP